MPDWLLWSKLTDLLRGMVHVKKVKQIYNILAKIDSCPLTKILRLKPRFGGKKKVNEIVDGFKILIYILFSFLKKS